MVSFVLNMFIQLTNRTPKTAVNAILIGSMDSPQPPSAHGNSMETEPDSEFTCWRENTIVTNKALTRRKKRHTVFLKTCRYCITKVLYLHRKWIYIHTYTLCSRLTGIHRLRIGCDIHCVTAQHKEGDLGQGITSTKRIVIVYCTSLGKTPRF